MLLDLLRGIERERAVGAAARGAGISYRNAWGLLRRWEERIGRSLVRMERGRGSSLTALGAGMLRLDEETRRQLAPALEAAAARMASLFEQAATQPAPALALQASHDLALGALAQLLRQRGVALDLEFRGSREALAALAAGKADLAGFHCALGPVGAGIWERYRPLLKERTHVLVMVARRSQGIMTAAGNPLGIGSLEDLQRVRLINRQSGSGTRLLFDALLRRQGIDAAALHGYGSAEFTHAAVAAMIASGQADAGIGIEAAARQFGLGFVPLAQEDYLLALRRARLGDAGIAALLELLRSDEFRAAADALAGYDTGRAGELLAPSQFAARLAQD